MSYQVLARKWRPQTFADIVGQEHVTTTLGNALATGRVAHAYLFTGPRGCGKTTMARLLAKALNCDEGPTAQPCGACPSCRGIAEGRFLDVMEIDAASHTGVDNVRELRENAQYQPTAGKKRIFIIDEVHMLSKGAFNALLKTLEEPPDHVHFIFATTEPGRIPRTILSRCQRFDFRLFTLAEIRGRLDAILAAEERQVQPEAVELLAGLAEGSMRDALSLLDQALSSVDGPLEAAAVQGLFGLVGHDLYLDLNEAVLQRDSRAALDLVDQLASSGHDLVDFARGLVGNFRDLLLLRLDPELAERVEKPAAVKERLAEQAQRFQPADLLHLTQKAADNFAKLERAPHPRWLLEAQVVDYAQLESRVLLSEILGRLQALQGGDGGAPAAPAGGRSRGEAAGSPGRGASARPTARPAARLDAAPSPVPAPAGPPAAIDLAEAFRRFAARARQKNMGVGTCLLQAAPRREEGRLLLLFPPDHDFQREQISDAGTLRWLGELTSECFGERLTVEAVQGLPEAGEDSLRREVQREVAPTTTQELDRLTREYPDLGRLLDGLGGRVVDEG